LIKVYLVEDEVIARGELKYLLQSNQVKVAGEAEDIHQAIWEIAELQPDVVFLDIHLEKGNGLELAKQLRCLKKPPFIVFATAYDEHACKAFELEAVDYILKPFDEDRIKQTLDKLAKWRRLQTTEGLPQQAPSKGEKTDRQVSKLAVIEGERIIVVDINQIVYVGTENRQVFVKTLDSKYVVDTPLYEIEQKLEGSSFLRVHRGYIINLDYVMEIEPWFNGTYNVIFRDGSKVPVSRSYIKDVRKSLGF